MKEVRSYKIIATVLLILGFLLDITTTLIGTNMGIKESNPLYYILSPLGFTILKSLMISNTIGLLYYLEDRKLVLIAFTVITSVAVFQIICGIWNISVMLGVN